MDIVRQSTKRARPLPILSGVLGMVLAISVPCSAGTVPATAPALTTLYNFPGGGGGSFLEAGLVLNSTTGVFYGATAEGGLYGWGTVYQLTPPGTGNCTGSAWCPTVIYSFNPSQGDGASPEAGLTLATTGVLYGTTTFGGSSDDGTVFSLTPPTPPGTAWTERVIHNFTGSITGGTDGAEPEASMVLTSKGVLYGTTYAGGTAGYGTVFSLTPVSGQPGAWNEHVLYNFTGLADGGNPVAGLVQSTTQVLYGTTYTGGMAVSTEPGSGYGTVFQLVSSGGGVWTESVLYSFTNGTDGSGPESGLAIHYTKTATVLYGSAFWAGSPTGCPLGGYMAGCGTIFSLTSTTSSGGGPWTLAMLHTFTGTGTDGAHPSQDLFYSSTAGGLYGTTFSGGSTTDACFGPSYPGCGTAFVLKPPTTQGGKWTESILHDFDGDDGAGPNGVISGVSGNYYGTTYSGGTAGGYGSVFLLVP
jgi:uncharacterized repeat protein (TIGR03803 family)